MRKNVFINQDINFANCEIPDVKQTLPSADFDSNNEHWCHLYEDYERAGSVWKTKK